MEVGGGREGSSDEGGRDEGGRKGRPVLFYWGGSAGYGPASHVR